MRILTAVVFLFFISIRVNAQSDSTLKNYFVQSKLDENCTAEIALTLFNQSLKLDDVNNQILEELLNGCYHIRYSEVNLKNLYQYKMIPADISMLYTVAGSCSFNKNGIYSFISCPYNVCEKLLRSNYESNMVTYDLTQKKKLFFDDIIDPLKKDSFAKFSLFLANRYHIKNVPSCYIASFAPLKVKGSNNVTTLADTVVLEAAFTGQFYLYENYLCVYLKAKHRNYSYNSMEISQTLQSIKYFLRPEFVKRLDLF
ncbi:MAG: hypothetical protein ACHQK8_00290 [Bacteroidia bacterium]